MNFWVSFVLPIFVCVVLPVMVVWLALRARQHSTDKNAEIMLKAIESGATIDPNLLKPQTEQKSLKEKLLGRLTGACVTSLLGVAFLIGGLLLGWNIVFLPIQTSLLGGILLGVIEIFAGAYISTQLANAIVFLVLIIVLLVKPTGLLGRKINEKV